MKKNDFVEMGLHHTVAVYLCVGAYLMNLMEVGVIFIFVHDIGDVLTYLVKGFAETRLNVLTASLFVILMVVWFYSRIYVLGYMIHQIWECQHSLDFHSPIMFNYIFYLLLILLVLHCYWFVLFVQIFLKYVTSGSTEDSQEKTEVT